MGDLLNWRVSAARRCVELLLVSMLAACSSGGGSDSSTPAPPPSPVSLSIVTSGNGSVTSIPSGINCGSTCTASFDSGATVTLTAVPGAGTKLNAWTGACTGSALSCAVSMTAAASVTATFVPIAVAEGWTGIATIPDAIALEQRAAIDDAGNSMLIWRGPTSSTNAVQSIFASRSIAGAEWTQPIEIDASATENAFKPELSVDPATGRAVAIWSSDSGLWGRAFAPETGWGAAQQIDQLPGFFGASIRNYRVGVDGVGEAVAVWEKNNNLNRFSIWSSRYVLASGWTTPVLIETNDGNGFQDVLPSLAVFGSGKAVAVWRSLGSGGFGIWTNSFNPSTGWGTATELVKQDGFRQTGFQAEVKADASGNAILAWNEFDINASTQRVSSMFTKRFVNGTWESANTLVAPGAVITGTVHSLPALAVAPGGRSMLGWMLEDRAFRASLATPGGAWGAVSAVKTPSASIELDGGTTAIDDAGRGFGAWVQWRPNLEDPQLWISRYVPGSGWGTPTLHQNNTDGSSNPSLVMNGRGNAVIVWLQQNRIRSRYFNPGG